MKFQNLVDYLDSLDEKFIPARELIIYRDHKLLIHHKSGYSDIERTKPLTGEEIYLTFSCTKISTCVGALRLVERGLLNLEDKVAKYLPEYEHLSVKENGRIRPAQSDLLVKHLFTMCGGLSYDIESEALKPLKDNMYATTRDVIRALAKEPLLFDPGTHFEYSLCHDVLGAVIETVSGKTLENYLKEEIYLPLGMNDTVFHLNEEQKKKLSLHYVFDREGECLRLGDNRFTRYHLSPKYESGGAGIYTTAKDYAKLADAIACGGSAYNGYEVLKPETVAMYSANWLEAVQLADFENKTGHFGHGYGLGVMVLLDRRPRKYKCVEGVFGWGGAAGTKMIMDTKNKLSFYYTQEVEGGPECSYEEHQHNRITNMIYESLLDFREKVE